jgi:tetratricopeptide (TPR) repeat protein
MDTKIIANIQMFSKSASSLGLTYKQGFEHQWFVEPGFLDATSNPIPAKYVFSQKKIAMSRLLLILLALTAFQACGPNMDKHRHHLDEGIADLYYNRYTSASENFEKAIKYNPDSHEAYFYRGNLRRNMKDVDGAMEDYNKAIELNPEYADAYYNRGLLNEFIFNSVQAGCEDFLMAEKLGKANVEDRARWCR